MTNPVRRRSALNRGKTARVLFSISDGPDFRLLSGDLPPSAHLEKSDRAGPVRNIGLTASFRAALAGCICQRAIANQGISEPQLSQTLRAAGARVRQSARLPNLVSTSVEPLARLPHAPAISSSPTQTATCNIADMVRPASRGTEARSTWWNSRPAIRLTAQRNIRRPNYLLAQADRILNACRGQVFRQSVRVWAGAVSRPLSRSGTRQPS